MAQKRELDFEYTYEYRTNGSAAVAPSYVPQRDNTAKPIPEREPRRQPQRRPKHAPKQKMVVAPMAVMGVAVAMLMLVLVLFGYSQVYESGQRVGDMENTIEDLQAENLKLRNKYDTSIDLQRVEERAMELGMQQPSAKQIVMLQIPVEDITVVTEKAASNPLSAAWEAVVDTAQSLWEYLH